MFGVFVVGRCCLSLVVVCCWSLFVVGRCLSLVVVCHWLLFIVVCCLLFVVCCFLLFVGIPSGLGGPGGQGGPGSPGGPGGPGDQVCQCIYGFHGLNYQIIVKT